jgi:hypothetical protein
MNYITPPSRVILQTKQELTYGSAFKKQGKIYLVIDLKVVDPKKSIDSEDVIVVEHSYWVVENNAFKKLPFEDRGDGSIPGVAKLTKDEVNQLGAWVLSTFPSVGSLPEYDREVAMLQKGSYAMVGQMAAEGKMAYGLTPTDFEDYTPIELEEPPIEEPVIPE